MKFTEPIASIEELEALGKIMSDTLPKKVKE